MRMYFDISLQGNIIIITLCIYLMCGSFTDVHIIAPSSFIMCDMLSGSVERIVSSSWLLLFLERVRILKWIVQRRQKSYHIHTQVSPTINIECDSLGTVY